MFKNYSFNTPFRFHWPNLIFILGYSLLLPFQTQAQGTLSGTTVAVQMGKQLTTYGVDATALVQGDSGANAFWDFSTVVANDTVNKTIVDPADTPYAVYFEEANLCFENSNGKYFYYGLENNKYEYHGNYDGTKIIWGDLEDHALLLEYPYSFGDAHEDDYTNQFVQNGFTTYRKGTMKIEADAYGDIQLPYGTVSGVVRVRIEETATDSLAFNIGNTSFSSITYIWYKSGLFHNVFFLNYYTTGGITYNSAAYLDQMTTSVNPFSNTAPKTLVYPNPAQGHTTLDFTLATADKVVFKLSDLSGKTVHESTGEFAAGQHQHQLNLQDLAPGTYLLQATQSEGTRLHSQSLMVY